MYGVRLQERIYVRSIICGRLVRHHPEGRGVPQHTGRSDMRLSDRGKAWDVGVKWDCGASSKEQADEDPRRPPA